MLNLIEVYDIFLVVLLLKLDEFLSLDKLEKEWDNLNVWIYKCVQKQQKQLTLLAIVRKPTK